MRTASENIVGARLRLSGREPLALLRHRFTERENIEKLFKCQSDYDAMDCNPQRVEQERSIYSRFTIEDSRLFNRAAIVIHPLRELAKSLPGFSGWSIMTAHENEPR